MESLGSDPLALWLPVGEPPISPLGAAALLAAVVFLAARVLAGRRPPPTGPVPAGREDAPAPLGEVLPSEDLDRLERSQPLAVFFVG